MAHVMTLAEYLSGAAATPFAYGRFDCLIFLADWIDNLRGIDLAAPWRGKYASEREASRLMAHYGGMEALLDFAVRGVLVPIDEPVAGDIGIVRPRGPNSEVGGIYDGKRWAALKRNGGLWFGPHHVSAAWGVR